MTSQKHSQPLAPLRRLAIPLLRTQAHSLAQVLGSGAFARQALGASMRRPPRGGRCRGRHGGRRRAEERWGFSSPPWN